MEAQLSPGPSGPLAFIGKCSAKHFTQQKLNRRFYVSKCEETVGRVYS